MSEHVLHVHTKDDLEKALDRGKPVVVKWWATWCRPCAQLSPHFERVAAEVKDKTFVEIDIERAPALAQEAGVQGIPRIDLIEDDTVREIKGRNVFALLNELK